MSSEVKATFTPGPWRMGLGMSNLGKFAIERTDGVCIAFVVGNDSAHNGGHPIGHNECALNAALIAAAPDLLEALEEARGLIEFWHGLPGREEYRQSPEMKRIAAAIAKARGA